MKCESTDRERLDSQFLKSGLTGAHLRAMQVELIKARGDRFVSLPVASARIPYFDLDGGITGFYRLRTLKDWTPGVEKKPRRYMQLAGSENQLYLPPLCPRPWRQIADDSATPVLITEGEKKAACGCVNGFETIGLGGVWNWQSGGAALPEFDRFEWKKRLVYLVFDSPDVERNPHVRAAIERLGSHLRSRGASVRYVTLPYADGEKVGLDDYIVAQGAPALGKLLAEAPDYVDVVSELNRSHAAVWLGAKAYVMREYRRPDGSVAVSFAKPAELRPMYADRFVTVPTATGDRQANAYDLWLRSNRRRMYDGIAFEPGRDIGKWYNLWRGLSVKLVLTPSHGQVMV